MMITYRIPSKKVPYGYLEFQVASRPAEGDGALPDPVALAEQYAQYIKDYQAAEVQAFENPAARQIKKADAKPEDDINVAAQMIKDGLGATEVNGTDPDAPWNEDETPTKSKPVADGDWDF